LAQIGGAPIVWACIREVCGLRRTLRKHEILTSAQVIMKTNPLKQGVLTENAAGIGTVTLEMVRKRATELAVIDGRSANEVSQSDLDEAKRELTGEPESDENELALESAPESERWDPIAGSKGHKTAVTSNDDEDEEGRSDSERLVEEGVAEAGHDRMLQAAKTQRQQNE
jgi:hypothetical protein